MAECVGCGYECRKVPCGYSQNQMNKEGKTWNPKTGCPYLRQVGIQWRCGLYIDGTPELKAEMASIYGVGIGAGCSASLFNSVRDEMISRLNSLSRSRGTSSETA